MMNLFIVKCISSFQSAGSLKTSRPDPKTDGNKEKAEEEARRSRRGRLTFAALQDVHAKDGNPPADLLFPD